MVVELLKKKIMMKLMEYGSNISTTVTTMTCLDNKIVSKLIKIRIMSAMLVSHDRY